MKLTLRSLRAHALWERLNYAGVALAIVVVVISALVAVMHLRQLALAHTVTATHNLAHSVELNIEDLINTIDLALQVSADEISRQLASGAPDKAMITRYLERQHERLVNVAFLRACNEHGNVLYGPDVRSPPSSIADRDYFLSLRDQPQAGLFIIKPLVGRITNKWVWSFARRINKPDGSFGGVVYAAINLEDIQRMLAQIAMESGGSIALRDDGLGLIARHTFGDANPILIGDRQLNAPFAQALKVNPQEASYTSDASSVDPVDRLYSYRRNAKYGFFVNVGMATQAALSDWHKQAWIVAALATAFSLAALAYARLTGRVWRHQEQNLAALAASGQALQESEARFRLFIQYAPAAIAMFDRGMRYLAYSQRWLVDYGLDEQHLIGRSHYEIFPDAPQHWKEIHQRSMAGAIQKCGEEPFTRTDGSVDWVQWEIYPWRTRGDDIGGIIIFSEVITERKRAEDALRESEQHNRLLFDSSPIGLALCHMDGTLVNVNPAYAAILGRSVEQTLKLNYWDITPEKYAEQERVQLALLRSSRRYGPYEKEYIHADGHHVPVCLNGLIVARKGEQFIWSSVEDITVRKQNQQKIRAQLDELLRWQEVMVGREERMLQLKAEVNALLARQGQPERYANQADS